MRTSILVLACAVIGFLPPAAWFTFRYQQVKVLRAASPALLRVIALGAFFIYCTSVVMYPPPSLYTCTARIWLREIGFSLTYGALMLKTWRISVIFRVRSAKAVKITDVALLKRLGVLCACIGVALLVRTIVAPPEVVVGRTADDLKAYLCKTNWWDHTFTSMEVLFLAWGVRLCIMVRKAPSEFNESRFISMAIYNEFLLTCFLNVSMLFLQSPANPDLLYIIFFCHTQLTVTLLLALIFGSKVYLVFRSGGKPHDDMLNIGMKASGAKFICRSQARTLPIPSTTTSSTAQLGSNADTRLTDQEALEEIRHLCSQLQCLQDRVPQRGVAIATISTLLEGCRATHPLTLQPGQMLNQNHIQINSSIRSDKSTNTDSNVRGKNGRRNHTNNTKSIVARNGSSKCQRNITTDSSIDLNFTNLNLKCMCSEECLVGEECEGVSNRISCQSIDNYSKELCLCADGSNKNNNRRVMSSKCNCDHTAIGDHDWYHCTNKICKKCGQIIKTVDNSVDVDDVHLSNVDSLKLNNVERNCQKIDLDVGTITTCNQLVTDDSYDCVVPPQTPSPTVSNISVPPPTIPSSTMVVLHESSDIDSKLLLVATHTDTSTGHFERMVGGNGDGTDSCTPDDGDDVGNNGSTTDYSVHNERTTIEKNTAVMESNDGDTVNKRNKSSDVKLVLDLNDRSKYTKEVSV